ncbi:Ctf8-domain-containing protein [Zychaea mexicana]|uniref:Ctf8-domain-containing protein n=1 Tax=Zychaea mexicana TaxID=64656 RepID=UPI0022FF0F72|nr:Ctf8-domain-containing protein [Zychaea mexicana]KAI9498973.1 Ctf8-domain-containing protein [Zychaea mexicana]
MVCAVICPLQSSQKEPSLVLLEFQGHFQSSESQVQSLKMGDLTMTNDKATVVVGHHRLEGKKVKLAKPFAVIRKRQQDDQTAMDTTTDDTPVAAVKYDTVTILREKYVFSLRPGLVVQESLRGLTRIGGIN